MPAASGDSHGHPAGAGGSRPAIHDVPCGPVKYDAVVIGSGPNGLAAAVALAQRGLSVHVLEANDMPGGGTRTAEITLPGFRHDICSSVHPTGAASPFFRSLPLDTLGLEWVRPAISFAHPLDDGSAAAMMHSLDEAVTRLGVDGPHYHGWVAPFVESGGALMDEVMRPLHVPRHPWLLARFGLLGLHSAAGIAANLQADGARSLIAATAAHGAAPLSAVLSSALGFVLLIAGHLEGWPVARGGSQAIAEALIAHLRALGGSIETGRRVTSMRDLPEARAYLFDVTPKQLLAIAGDHLPSFYRWRLGRFQYGPGVFKIDYALNAPIPWRARECRETATVHAAGTFDETIAAEDAVGRGRHPERPLVIVTQPSVIDSTRAPAGKHTAWAYCHVPNGSNLDMTEAIERQIERFAPGFRDTVLARVTSGPHELEEKDANYVGGDVAGGLTDWKQLFTRPVARLDPYATPNARIFLCSSSTPPGGGVHGMCGYWAAQSVLASL
jgi:phytoene dehydrogenase-like protein